MTDTRADQLRWLLLLMAVFFSTAMPYSLQRAMYLFQIGDLHFNLADVIFAANLFVWILSMFLRPELRFHRLLIPLVAFLLWLIVPVMIALLRGEIFWLIRNLRVFAYYLYAFMFSDLIRSDKHARNIITAFLSGIGFSFGLFLLHISGQIVLPGASPETFALCGALRNRVFFIDQYLTWVGLSIGIALILWRKNVHWRWLIRTATGITAISLVLVGGRSDILIAIIAIITMWIYLRRMKWGRSSQMFRAVFVVIIGIFLADLFLPQVDIPAYLSSQFRSFTNFRQEMSFQFRWAHYLASWENTMRSPLIGNGLGTILPLDLQMKYNLTREPYSGGNAWMDLTERAGIIGLTLFLWFEFRVLGTLIKLSRSRVVHQRYAPVVASLLAIWLSLFVEYTIGHAVIRWQTYGVTIGWLLGIVVYLCRQMSGQVPKESSLLRREGE